MDVGMDEGMNEGMDEGMDEGTREWTSEVMKNDGTKIPGVVAALRLLFL